MSMRFLPVVLLTAGSFALVAADKPADKMVCRVYQVADLVTPLTDFTMSSSECKTASTPCEAVCQAAKCAAEIAASRTEQPDHLMKMIAATVAPRTWSAGGGAGCMDYYPIGMALVVRNTPEVHEQVAAMLEALRKLQDVQVAVELRFVSVGTEAFERIGIDFEGCPNKPVGMTDGQVFQFLEACQGDRRTNVLQAPKVTLFNGQRGSVQAIDTHMFVVGVDVVKVNGAQTCVPVNKPHETGLKIGVRPTVSADKRFVKLELQADYTQLASTTIPLHPITSMITPVFEGGSQGPPIPFTQFIQKPEFTTLGVDTKLCIPDGGTMMLYAGQYLRETRTEFGPPVLSKVPYVNRLFKNVGIAKEPVHMYVMVTPRVIVNGETVAKDCAKDCCKDCPKGTCTECPPGCCKNVVVDCPKDCCKGCPVATPVCPPCPSAKPMHGVEEASAPIPAIVPEVKKSAQAMRLEKMADRLVEKYHKACAEGDAEKARKLARQALDIDPTCFSRPAALPGEKVSQMRQMFERASDMFRKVAFPNSYSSDPNTRMQMLINQSEDLRQIEHEWRQIWIADQPSHVTPERVHGGIQ